MILHTLRGDCLFQFWCINCGWLSTLFSLKPAQPHHALLFLCGFIHLFKLDPWYPRLLQKHNMRKSVRTAKCRAGLPSRWRPLQPTNHTKVFRASTQSERGEHWMGSSRAASKRDTEIVEERRLVGHECHSLRVLIIWRGACSARPVRLPGGNPGGAETKLNRDDWWTHFRTGEIPSRLSVGPHYRLRRKEIDRVWERGIGRFANNIYRNLTTSAGREMILLQY